MCLRLGWRVLTIRYRMEMPQAPSSRRGLDRRVWALAALAALAEGGLAAVAVEPLARRLGATKGSFYWHFPDRQALLIAALALYEQEGTDSVIGTLREQPSSDEQLRSLFAMVFRDEGGDPVYNALLANARDPTVGPVLQRITAGRLDYLVGAMAAVGHSRAEARHRAVLAYTTWLGLVQTERAVAGRLFESEQDRGRYLDFVEDILLGGAGRRPEQGPH